jgi:hypothetical protein
LPPCFPTWRFSNTSPASLPRGWRRERRWRRWRARGICPRSVLENATGHPVSAVQFPVIIDLLLIFQLCPPRLTFFQGLPWQRIWIFLGPSNCREACFLAFETTIGASIRQWRSTCMLFGTLPFSHHSAETHIPFDITALASATSRLGSKAGRLASATIRTFLPPYLASPLPAPLAGEKRLPRFLLHTAPTNPIHRRLHPTPPT